MTVINELFFAIGSLAATWSGCYLVFTSLNKKGGLWKTAKAVYISLAVFQFYYAVIYALTCMGVLGLYEYGNYLRPTVAIMYMAPALIAIIHRKRISL